MIKKILISVVVIVVLLLSAIKTVKMNKENKLINSSYSITIGKIISYTEIGISNYYLKYEYEVNGQKFINEVIPKVLYKDCQHNKKCIGSPIFVKYYVKDCSISEPIYDSIPDPSSPKSN